MVVLGLVMSLIGGIAPRLIKANGNIDVIIRGESNVSLAFGKAQAKSKKTASASKAVAKKTTKAWVKKGKTMTTINTQKGVGNASSLPGE